MKRKTIWQQKSIWTDTSGKDGLSERSSGNWPRRWKTVGAFIRELAPQVEMIMSGQSWREPFRNKQELADWCRDNQPYYKKRIPEVNSHFAKMYNLK